MLADFAAGKRWMRTQWMSSPRRFASQTSNHEFGDNYCRVYSKVVNNFITERWKWTREIVAVASRPEPHAKGDSTTAAASGEASFHACELFPAARALMGNYSCFQHPASPPKSFQVDDLRSQSTGSLRELFPVFEPNRGSWGKIRVRATAPSLELNQPT